MNEATKYLALCLDPVHVGTGGYRLGRVDMSIVREPATGIPKVPGTSLAGAIRAYAELAKAEDHSLPEIDEVFGTAEGDQGKQGMLRFYDAEIVLFPVGSHIGTVWVSTREQLMRWLQNVSSESKKLPVPDELQDENKVLIVKGLDGAKPVHLGWLLLEAEAFPEPTVIAGLPAALAFVRRLVIVSDKLFFHLVNDHLEVRTSVSIDEHTGAAKTGALFTYEAIPRGTVLGFEVGVDSRRAGRASAEGVRNLRRKAFATLKLLGIGGMGTRGFGRLEVLNSDSLVQGATGVGGDEL